MVFSGVFYPPKKKPHILLRKMQIHMVKAIKNQWFISIGAGLIASVIFYFVSKYWLF